MDGSAALATTGAELEDSEKSVPDHYPLSDLKDADLEAIVDDDSVQDEFREQARDLLVARRERQEALAASQEALDAEDGPGDGKAEELKSEAGEPVGEMPPADPESTEVAPEEIIVAGTCKLGELKVGGKKPASAVLKLKLGTLKVEGAYRKGEKLTVTVDAVVVGEGAVDVLDPKTKQVTESVQEHRAVALDVKVKER